MHGFGSMTKQAVVVTGASSGIGLATTRLLVREGFAVFAGVRKAEDGERLKHEIGSEVVPVQLDVTQLDSISRARDEVTERLGDGGSLAGLVNNAGIGLSGPLEHLSLTDVRRMFEVDVVGQIAVTQAFLPLLRAARGRIVNIGSVGDRISIPFGGVLSACKSALASLSESWRMELRPWGIHVVIIEPGSINTPAADKTLGDPEGALRRMGPDAERQYGQMFRNFTERAIARERHGSPPEVVAAAVLRALRDRHPRRRYPVGKDARLLTNLPRLIPDWLLDPLRMRLFGLPARFGALTRAPH